MIHLQTITMNWYLVKIIYQIICGEGKHTPQFDEQVRLIATSSPEQAIEKGRCIGLQEEDVFYNKKQQLVQWKFVNITEVYALTEVMDGAEVYSQTKEIDDAEGYRSFVHHKAGMLHKSFSSPTLQTF